MFNGGPRGGARGAQPPPLFLDQTEAQRAQKKILETAPPSPILLSQGLDDRDPSLSQGLNPALMLVL